MKRSGFKRREIEQRPAPVYRKLTRTPNYNGGLKGGVPKREYVRSAALLEACRLIPCQHCGKSHETGKVCAAHSNWGVHGKGGHIKADDNRVASLCDDCHVPILDQGAKLSAAERIEMWWSAHVATVTLLQRLQLWPDGVPVPELTDRWRPVA